MLWGAKSSSSTGINTTVKARTTTTTTTIAADRIRSFLCGTLLTLLCVKTCISAGRSFFHVFLPESKIIKEKLTCKLRLYFFYISQMSTTVQFYTLHLQPPIIPCWSSWTQPPPASLAPKSGLLSTEVSRTSSVLPSDSQLRPQVWIVVAVWRRPHQLVRTDHRQVHREE